MTKIVLSPLPAGLEQARARYTGRDVESALERFADDEVIGGIIAEVMQPGITTPWYDDGQELKRFDGGNARDLRKRNGEFYNIWNVHLVNGLYVMTGLLMYRFGVYPGFEVLGSASAEASRIANRVHPGAWNVR